MKPAPTLSDMAWVAFGGMIGAGLRYFTNLMVAEIPVLPFLITATAIENVIGSFLIGLIFTFLMKRADNSHKMSLFLLTGIIGSYTTYSGFMIEAFTNSGISIYIMIMYVFSQILTGIIAVIGGIYLAKKLIRS
jgi:fluoride exporter